MNKIRQERNHPLLLFSVQSVSSTQSVSPAYHPRDVFKKREVAYDDQAELFTGSCYTLIEQLVIEIVRVWMLLCPKHTLLIIIEVIVQNHNNIFEFQTDCRLSICQYRFFL